MSTSPHTPTPWRAFSYAEASESEIFKDGRTIVADITGATMAVAYTDYGTEERARANAAYIVVACNSHEASKAIIAELVKDMREIACSAAGVDTVSSLEEAFGRAILIARAAVTRIDAATAGETPAPARDPIRDELVKALRDAVDSLEYVQRLVGKDGQPSGWGVRAERIKAAHAALSKASASNTPATDTIPWPCIACGVHAAAGRGAKHPHHCEACGRQQ